MVGMVDTADREGMADTVDTADREDTRRQRLVVDTVAVADKEVAADKN